MILSDRKAGKSLANQEVSNAKADNPNLETHQAALEARRGLELKFIKPNQDAKNYANAVAQGVKEYVAAMPLEKQPIDPDKAGKIAKNVYNNLGKPEGKGGFGIHAVAIKKKH